MSDKKEDGGAAFPMQMPIDDAGNPMSASVMGMSLRAYFAAAAMQGLLASETENHVFSAVVNDNCETIKTAGEVVSMLSVMYADALIKELGE